MRLLRVLLLSAALAVVARAAPDFPLADAGSATPFLLAPGTAPAVARAADDVRRDIETITGALPPCLAELPAAASATAQSPSHHLVLVGVVGQSPLLDQIPLLATPLHALRGQWESFVIAVVEHPLPGVDRALVIAGSDPRGAIYGLYEVSAQLGVSPWHWWADVPPPKKSTLTLPATTHRFGPPSVKYRGIFLNDEDWGLQPWAAKTFEPASGGIGPRTYARVCELLLRLRANTLWPAMHACTPPFFANPENARVAAAYGIALGSSHAEPMLRNNVSEWPHDRAADYNYLTHRDDVLHYWDERVAEVARDGVDAIYTLGMRGIHDSAMQGPRTDAERIATLERIFADQRALLARHRRPDVARVPQIFCAYKEVLDLYRQGLRVPDDVTLVWPDDNFGYLRHLASPAERTRSGSFGVYYHLSYLGRPLSYLWLCTTPPALIWEELHKAYAHGADRLWIANVGDLKPAEIPLTFFLELAWDAHRWTPATLPQFLPDFAARTFGPTHAPAIGALLADYYQLNFPRKPEHLQAWLPREPRRPSPLTDAAIDARLAAFADLRARADALRPQIPAPLADAFYELVYYPIVGSALANARYFLGERGSPADLAAAHAADARLTAETEYFNTTLAGGKWRGLMSLEPADDQWSSMRLARWSPPATPRAPVPSPAPGTVLTFAAADFTANHPASTPAFGSTAPASDVAMVAATWTLIPGLGHTGRALTVLPTSMPPLALAEAATRAPRLDYTIPLPAPAALTLQLHLLPSHPVTGSAFELAYALDDDPPQLLTLARADSGTPWAQGVLEAERLATLPLRPLSAGTHRLHLYALTPGVTLDRLSLVHRSSASAPPP